MTTPEQTNISKFSSSVLVNQPAEKTIRYLNSANKARTVTLSGAEFDYLGSRLFNAPIATFELKELARRSHLSAKELADHIRKKWSDEHADLLQVNVLSLGRFPGARIKSVFYPSFSKAAEQYGILKLMAERVAEIERPAAIWMSRPGVTRIPDVITAKVAGTLMRLTHIESDERAYVETAVSGNGITVPLNVLLDLGQKWLIPDSTLGFEYLTNANNGNTPDDNTVKNLYNAWKTLLSGKEFQLNTVVMSAAPTGSGAFMLRGRAFSVRSDRVITEHGLDYCRVECVKTNEAMLKLEEILKEPVSKMVVELFSWIGPATYSTKVPDWVRAELEKIIGAKAQPLLPGPGSFRQVDRPIPVAPKASIPKDQECAATEWVSVHSVSLAELTVGKKLLVGVLNFLRPAVLKGTVQNDAGTFLQIKVGNEERLYSVALGSETPVWFEREGV